MEDLSAIRAADAVILPQGCSEKLYAVARENCSNVFPNYDAYFRYPGKTGQARLFRETGVSRPETLVLHDLKALKSVRKRLPFDFPFVFKCSWGGEGKYVFPIRRRQDFHMILEKVAAWERKGKYGYIMQEYVPTGGRSLRVVVIGNDFHSYWRVQKDSSRFHSNLARGALVDADSDPALQEAAVSVLKEFCGKTGINLAGFDFLFSVEPRKPVPLFLEINYFFRYRGLGGAERYFRLFEKGVKGWLLSLGRGKRQGVDI